MEKDLNKIYTAFNKIKNELSNFQQQLNQKKEQASSTHFVKRMDSNERIEIIKNIIQQDKEINSDYSEMQNRLNSEDFANLPKREKILVTNQERARLIKKIRDSVYLKNKLTEIKEKNDQDETLNLISNIKITKVDNESVDNESLISVEQNNEPTINEDNSFVDLFEQNKDIIENNFSDKEFKEFIDNTSLDDNNNLFIEQTKENIADENVLQETKIDDAFTVSFENIKTNDEQHSYSNNLLFSELNNDLEQEQQPENTQPLFIVNNFENNVVPTQEQAFFSMNDEIDLQEPKQEDINLKEIMSNQQPVAASGNDMVVTKDFLEQLKNSGQTIGKDFNIENQFKENDNYIRNTDDDMWLMNDDAPKKEANKSNFFDKKEDTKKDFKELEDNPFLSYLNKK